MNITAVIVRKPYALDAERTQDGTIKLFADLKYS